MIHIFLFYMYGIQLRASTTAGELTVIEFFISQSFDKYRSLFLFEPPANIMGDDSRRWSEEPFRMVSGPAAPFWVPPARLRNRYLEKYYHNSFTCIVWDVCSQI